MWVIRQWTSPKSLWGDWYWREKTGCKGNFCPGYDQYTLCFPTKEEAEAKALLVALENPSFIGRIEVTEELSRYHVDRDAQAPRS